MNSQNPCEVVEAGGGDLDARHGLLDDAVHARVELGIGVCADSAFRDFDTQDVGQQVADHAVAFADLVAETNNLDIAVTRDGIADAHHGIAIVDEPGVRTGLLHRVRDFEDRSDIAQGMGETAGTAVLGIGLAHTVFKRELVVAAPEAFTGGNLDGRDDEGGVFEGVHVMRMGCDRHLCIPFAVDSFGEGSHGLESVRILVDEGDVAAAQAFAAHECADGVEAEAGAAGSDDDNLGG